MGAEERILQGMTIQVGGGKYTIPITSIRQSLKANQTDLIVDPNGNEMLKIQGEIYNLERLHEFFNVRTDVTDIEDGIVMLLEHGGKWLAVFADAIIGEASISVNPLPGYLPKIKGVSGCAIINDDEIHLILEVSDFFDDSLSAGNTAETANDETAENLDGEHDIQRFPDNSEMKDKYFTFAIDGEEYGIEVAHIKEIIGVRKITEVPATPYYVEGIISLRGEVVPVIDARKRFNKADREYDVHTCVIVVNYRKYTIGLVVDRVEEVIYISKDEISPPPSAKADYYNQYISGLGKTGDSVKQLIDLDNFLFQI